MNHQTIIDWKLSNINKNVTAELVLTDEMQQYIELHPELVKELAFIDAFWQQDNQELPSSELDQRFYKMLSQAQTAQQNIDTNQAAKQSKQVHVFTVIKNWLSTSTIKPFAQFAILGLVFFLGFNANNGRDEIAQQGQYLAANLAANNGIDNLQQEVSSLSAMLALSMLDKSSAAERLSGVAYSQQTDLTDPLLMKTLMSTLEHDRSTAVKLAIINTLNDLPDISEQEHQLLAFAIKENNTLVKIELCRLLFNIGSSVTKNELLQALNESELNPDMAEFLQRINAISHI
ncbi:hypothetical protein EKO29_20260 [Colwellia sp. Arc7-635]|uniref:hypothetical protein n=1 Tax=Colwellia sp. Arc7-635 TaxID=2497879 RepID=UPI000F85958A|nr:hypothetical protein [Colwellia sp. Arc7-635]AZQ86121.1 hypothetical protein EKO29_20260 [Colwellia sp. Arc7-635]